MKPLQMIKNRSIPLIALLCALCLAMSSCGVLLINKPSKATAEVTEPEDTTSPPETEPVPDDLKVVEKDYTEEMHRFEMDLSGTKYNGAVARIVSTSKKLLLPDENTPKLISEDLVERNETVESKLGISLTFDERESEVLFDEVKIADRASTYYADIIMYPQNMIGAFVTAGAVLNMNSLPGFETDSGYFYSSAVMAGTGGDALYAVAGPASLDLNGLSCIFFNKDIIESLGLESPYDLVDRGEWTIDKYLEYTAAAETLEGEYYAYGAQHTSNILVDLFYFAQGETLTASTQGSYPVTTLGSAKTADVINKVRSATVGAVSSGNSLTAIETFKSGKTMFLIDRLDNIRDFASLGIGWGILPMPKYNAQQTYHYTLVNYEEALVFSTLSAAPNYSMTADILACINFTTYGYTKDAYVTDATYYYLRDNASIRMMDHIIDHPVFDFAYSFASTYNAIPSITYMAVRNVVSEVNTLENYINQYGWSFENAMYNLFDVQP